MAKEKDLNSMPRVGDTVMVWPALRTVRDANRQPVLKDGQPEMQPALVRDHAGHLITAPLLVKITPYYHKLIANRRLAWGTREQHLGNIRAAAKAAVGTQKPDKATKVTRQQPDNSAASQA
jgi:hypothetical protein